MASYTEAMTNTGRFAPSPTGDFHLGNLRTAILAWAWARTTGRRFVLRIEDIDRERAGSAQRLSDDDGLGECHATARAHAAGREGSQC